MQYKEQTAKEDVKEADGKPICGTKRRQKKAIKFKRIGG
jgi:hypothetical protein